MIDYILWIVNVIVNVIVILLPYLGGLSLLAIILVVSIPYLKKKISVSQIIKEHADALIGAVVIFILILPFILWKSGYYGENKFFANSASSRVPRLLGIPQYSPITIIKIGCPATIKLLFSSSFWA